MQNNPTNDGHISLKEAAERYGVQHDRLRRAAYEGRLLGNREGQHWIVQPSEVERFIRDNGRAPVIAARPRREGIAAARVIALAIPKGGTGKTTTTLNLGVALAEVGQRVLLIDCDPGAGLTTALRREPQRMDATLGGAIARYIADYSLELDRAVSATEEGIDLVPADTRLSTIEDQLRTVFDPQRVLSKLIAPLRTGYDVILIDTMPTLGLLVQNALVAADEVLIPLQAQAMATESAKLLLKQIIGVRRSEANTRLKVAGFLFNQVTPAEMNQREQMAYVRRSFGAEYPVLHTTIEDRAVVRESQMQVVRQSLFRYRPSDPATNAYRALAQEILHGST
ncbi:MAG: AAA family ATPase [Herpetosiphonaceae bacterium]|nr:AAA family ATPase [Herpetosiphonaceae bacterium]